MSLFKDSNEDVTQNTDEAVTDILEMPEFEDITQMTEEETVDETMMMDDFMTEEPETTTMQMSEFVAGEATDEVSEISQGTKIAGSITTDGSINVYGHVDGDVICKGKAVVTGTIEGKLVAGEVYANNAKVNGDVVSDGSVKIGSGSIIVGNIAATSAVVGGAIRGDIDVHGPVIIDTTAIVQGNIKSTSVQINNGAAIEGFCSQCYAEIDYDALFEATFAK